MKHPLEYCFMVPLSKLSWLCWCGSVRTITQHPRLGLEINIKWIKEWNEAGFVLAVNSINFKYFPYSVLKPSKSEAILSQRKWQCSKPLRTERQFSILCNDFCVHVLFCITFALPSRWNEGPEILLWNPPPTISFCRNTYVFEMLVSVFTQPPMHKPAMCDKCPYTYADISMCRIQRE